MKANRASVMTCSADDADNILTTAADSQVPATKIGTVGGDAIRIGDLIDVSLTDAADAWLNGFGQ